MKNVVVVDADAIVAQTCVHDPNHIKAVEIAKKLSLREAKLVYPITAIVEAGAFIQRVLGNGRLSQAVMSSFFYPHVLVYEIERRDLERAVRNYFNSLGTKKNTVFDCIVAAVADRHDTKEIFSFDSFYRKRGFDLVTGV